MKPMKILDAPEIRQMERFGCLRGNAEPRCPVCGKSCEWLYYYKGQEVVGCDCCVTRVDAERAKEERWNGNR